MVAHYGDLVKYICQTYFNWNGEKDEYGRSLLQHVGTDVVRHMEPDYWVEFIVRILRFFPDEWDYVVIPDARFPNEIRVLEENGLQVTHLRVRRDSIPNNLTEEQRNHPSETSLDHTTPDAWIDNEGSLRHLEEVVKQYLEDNIYG